MDDNEAMIEDCLNRESRMTDWERGFIQSLGELNSIEDLSPKQLETLEKIWERIT